MDPSTTTTSTPSETTSDKSNIDFDFASYLTVKNLFIVIGFSLILYFALSRNETSATEEGDTGSSSANVFMLVLALAIIFAGYKLYQSYEITTEVTGDGSKNNEVDISINHLVDSSSSTSTSASTSQPTNEVFNIPGNYYTYESARAVCKAYEADLATYDQVEKAYNSGAEWCNYGWSEGQMALFPTQQASYDKLQTIKGHEHDCGRPGVNGGYIANPNVRFGVNCYGKKPAQTQYEADLMKTQENFPLNEKDILFQKQVNYWKSKINDILVSPFNYTSWSKI